MKITTQVATLAMCASLLLTMVLAQASLTINGLPMNGLMTNGVPLNGMPLNGITLNALTVNGLAAHEWAPGSSLYMASPQGEPPPAVQRESLPFHRLSQRALGTAPPSRLGLLNLCSRYRFVPLCL